MNCKEFEKLIPDFLADRLDKKSEASFCAHIEKCPSCKEELTIQFLITEGIHKLESGEDMDINAELERKFAGTKRRMRNRSLFTLAMQYVQEFFFFFAILIILWLFL